MSCAHHPLSHPRDLGNSKVNQDYTRGRDKSPKGNWGTLREEDVSWEAQCGKVEHSGIYLSLGHLEEVNMEARS
jgi:hypothetical protein